MHAALKGLDSADFDPATYWPEDETCFCLWVEMTIGVAGGQGGDLFQMKICTPEWIRKEYGTLTGVFPSDMLIVFEYDWKKIEHFLRERIGRLSGESWSDLVEQIRRFASWEFDRYPQPKD
ncbi:Imm8 family immunity protein [Paraburkholderia sp.]|uniref:Imm8 family immunity protein n=1 Tax=Paraburkholderia sp. TaxID=1926495 RepID=UPI002398A79F|nr:Imm8 family immunity protein [Paraburkholderia sp.]MDE1182570.1 Imm8 family immunity protein [Paraburkholderia sp.]